MALIGQFGCMSVGGVSDGSSVSYAWGNSGRLLVPRELPALGDGYQIPPVWNQRGLRFGTDELVSMVVRAARYVETWAPGAKLYVGDLSLPSGGRSAFHRSHQSGRDVDLHFYAKDSQGRPAGVPPTMYRYDATGAAVNSSEPLFFDVERNWLLVAAMLQDPGAEVQYIFVSYELQNLLLAYAMDSGQPLDLIQRAADIMHQPGDSLPHDDHFHVRIYCSRSDIAMGCRDQGPERWLKKLRKYENVAMTTVPSWIDALIARAFPASGTKTVRPALLAWL